MLEVRDLRKTYATGDAALRGVSFTIDRPEAVFVIGPSGAGKSTLLRCVNRLVEPDGGSVKLDGVEVTALAGGALREARRAMGMIFQEFNLVERLTVMENVRVLPQVLPRAIGLTIYQWDVHLRQSTIIGIVGAGGIGATLLNAFSRYDYDFALAILLVIVGIVLVGEAVSAIARRAVQ